VLAFAMQGPATIEVDPIKCWWQTSKGAITVGEVFELAITCAVLENQTVQVVPDESRLAVSSIQLQPFEILGGSHPADTRAGGRRFLQYQYQLRLIDPGAFGADIKVPPQQIHYRVQTQVAADAALQGRDLIYLLPAIPLRVVSQVPREAEDIRDGTTNLLERSAALGTRAGILEIAAIALVVIGAVLALAALVRALGGVRLRTAVDAGRAPAAVILRAVSGELEEVQRRSGIEGWTTDLVQRALAAVRVAAAACDGARISQRIVKGGNPFDSTGLAAGVAQGRRPAFARREVQAELRRVRHSGPSGRDGGEGRLLVTHGWFRKGTVAVSSAQTRTADEGLARALASLTSAAYGSGAAPDRAALDEAMTGAIEAARRLVRERTGPAAWLRARLAEHRR
jgi:hypothetical protein